MAENGRYILFSSDNINVKLAGVCYKEIWGHDNYINLFSVEEVNKKVKNGTPFREAYRQVAEEIEEDTFSPDRQLEHSHEGSIGNLCNHKIREKFEKVFHSW